MTAPHGSAPRSGPAASPERDSGVGFSAEQVAGWKAQLADFRSLLEAAPADLRRVKPAPEAWSLQEIVGHLVDSAVNNFQRFSRLQLADSIDVPGYDAEGWVRAGHYQAADWDDLTELWRQVNAQLLHVVARLPGACLDHLWLKPDAPEPLPLRDIVTGYFTHIGIHRDQFIRRQAEAAATIG